MSAEQYLSFGDQGEGVKLLQQRLSALGYETGFVDGRFGKLTEEAVFAFQEAQGLTVDGIVGPQTWAALETSAAAAAAEESDAAGAAVADASGRPTLRPGMRNDAVRSLQERLSDLSYWLGNLDGAFGLLTTQAVYAFQGLNGLRMDGIVGPNTWGALDGAGPPAPHRSGDHVEVDKTHQVIQVVRGSRVWRTFHTSTGTEKRYQAPGGSWHLADTPVGDWTIFRSRDGWHVGSLGRMYRPRYFHQDGIAIHGSTSIPPYPASHGCCRVTIRAMDLIWSENLAPMRSQVVVHGRFPGT